jgi:hypothetical protein
MRKEIVYALLCPVLLIFVVVGSAGTAGAQESATAEVSPATPEKVPTLKELAAALTAVQLENSQLKAQVQALQNRVANVERQPSVADLDRRVQALEQAGTEDIYQRLGIRRDQTLESWHREIHKRDRSLRGWNERELEDWHKRDHERRRNLLRNF